MLRPPSTAKHTPVKNTASSEARNSTAVATSLGSVSLPSGIVDSSCWRTSSGSESVPSAAFMKAVSAATGFTAFDANLERRDLASETAG